jgi:hypothetical protein
MTHTPGPWRFSQDGGEPYWSVAMPLCGGDGYGSGNAMVYTSESDARLIAAAPDLLATCKALAHDIRAFQFTDGEYRLSEDSARQILALLDREITKATEGTDGKERSLD